MTRAANRNEARMTRAARKAYAPIGRAAAGRALPARAQTKALAREKARRARDARRLQACAAVFVRSRIHFDARRGVPLHAATDRVPCTPAGAHDADNGTGPPARERHALQITFH